MQKKIITTICFIALAAVLIGAAVWYDSKEEQKNNEALSQAGQEAIATQNTIMQNFQQKDDVVGTGAAAQNGDTVNVLYTGSLDDGTVFDSTSKRNNQPFSFTLGVGQVIKGWDLGVVNMKVGGKRELIIPSELGYGATPPPGSNIPPNATLHFTVELLSIGTSSASGVGQ